MRQYFYEIYICVDFIFIGGIRGDSWRLSQPGQKKNYHTYCFLCRKRFDTIKGNKYYHEQKKFVLNVTNY